MNNTVTGEFLQHSKPQCMYRTVSGLRYHNHGFFLPQYNVTLMQYSSFRSLVLGSSFVFWDRKEGLFLEQHYNFLVSSLRKRMENNETRII